MQSELFESGEPKDVFKNRQTNRGTDFEAVVGFILQRGQYRVSPQQVIGTRLGATDHRVDFVAKGHDDAVILVSAKWQVSTGTGEDKIAWEVICLSEALQRDPMYRSAYIVLGGEGWTETKKAMLHF